MRKRRSLLGLLVLAGVVGLAFVALRERPARSRSVPRPAPGTMQGTGQAEAKGGERETDLGEGALWGNVTAPKEIDFSQVRIDVSTPLGAFPSTNTGVANFRAAVEVAADGTFRRDGLPLGEYRLLATHPLFAPYRTGFELEPGHGTGPLEVALGSLGSLVVRVVGPDGRGLAGEHVALHRGEGTPEHIDYRLEPARPETGAGCTDAEGKIRFENLQPGAYTLTRRGTVIEQRAATVQAAVETAVLFNASASLFGRLLGHDGQALPGAKLHVTAPSGRIYETLTDDRGAFAIRGIAAGEYGVTASVKEIGTAAIPLAETVVIEDGRTHERDLRLPAIRLVGSVVHAESGAPFTSRKASVSAVGVTFRTSALTSADGRFELVGLYPGWYRVTACPDPPDHGFVEDASSQEVTVTPTPATQGELVLGIPRIAKTARLRLTVRDRNGNPAENLVFTIDGHTRVQYAKGVYRSRDASVVEPGVYDILLVPNAHRIHVMTQPSGTEPARRSCYCEEIAFEVESGQTIEKSITLEKLVGLN